MEWTSFTPGLSSAVIPDSRYVHCPHMNYSHNANGYDIPNALYGKLIHEGYSSSAILDCNNLVFIWFSV